MKLTAAVAALAILLSFSTPDIAQTNCVPFAEVKKQIADGAPPLVKFRMVKKPRLAEALKLYGHAKDEPFTKYDAAALVEIDGGGGVIIVGNGALACDFVRVAADKWEAVKLLLEDQKV